MELNIAITHCVWKFIVASSVLLAGCSYQCVVSKANKPSQMSYSEHLDNHKQMRDALQHIEGVSVSLSYDRDEYSYITACYKGLFRDERKDQLILENMSSFKQKYGEHCAVKTK